jgi:hypothetical protein
MPFKHSWTTEADVLYVVHLAGPYNNVYLPESIERFVKGLSPPPPPPQ